MAAPMFNFNVGVLGHVDSGKTSLSKALSTTASTACFDKNPQSKERGITLDLGFSSFTVDMPEHLGAEYPDLKSSKLQYTLVDCPGHASLIRTIIGGNTDLLHAQNHIKFVRCCQRSLFRTSPYFPINSTYFLNISSEPMIFKSLK